jgi:hypothetical protein
MVNDTGQVLSRRELPGFRFVPFEKTELASALLGDDTNLIGAARVWYDRTRKGAANVFSNFPSL